MRLPRMGPAGFVYKSGSRDNTGNICFMPRKNSQRVFQDGNAKYWSRFAKFAPCPDPNRDLVIAAFILRESRPLASLLPQQRLRSPLPFPPQCGACAAYPN